jgi:dTDP-4-dehydrorhamnose reductase
MRILILGEKGQLGQSLKKAISKSELKDEFFFSGREDINLEDLDSITNFFIDNDFEIMINCAAYTFVDNAESNKGLADKINYLSVKSLAQIANRKNMKFIHISTDYVFDGNKETPYYESDEVNPINAYGASKLAGEKAIQNIMSKNAIILRTSWMYSEFGANFLDTILKKAEKNEELGIVSDQIGSPTYAGDLAEALLMIIQNNTFRNTQTNNQIYHYSNGGSCSWFDFAKLIVETKGLDCKIKTILTKDFPTAAKRPQMTIMNKDKIVEAFGIQIFDWKQSLKKCITLI